MNLTREQKEAIEREIADAPVYGWHRFVCKDIEHAIAVQLYLAGEYPSRKSRLTRDRESSWFTSGGGMTCYVDFRLSAD